MLRACTEHRLVVGNGSSVRMASLVSPPDDSSVFVAVSRSLMPSVDGRIIACSFEPEGKVVSEQHAT